MSGSEQTPPDHAPSTSWWIATDLRRNNGKKLLGPFATYNLALQVRDLYEQVHAPATFAVDEWPDA